MKTLSKIFLAALLFIGFEKLTRTQTHAFRVEKTQTDFPSQAQWEVAENPLPEVLNQPFYFLGSGVQFYVFLSEDQTAVLKVFKHYHFGLKSTLLRHFPFTKNAIDKRKQRIDALFSSALLAYHELPEKTGVFFLNLNPKHDYPTITIYDKIGIKWTLNLNTTPFLLQKKATPLLSYLDAHPRDAKTILDSLFACIAHRENLYITNTDPRIQRNFGIHEGEVIEIDVGSFVKTPQLANSCFSKGMTPLKKWIEKNAPELDDFFEGKMKEVKAQ